MSETAKPNADPQRKAAVRAHITAVLMERVSRDDARRAEALRDYLALTQAADDVAAAETLSLMIPPLMPALYRRWIGMFCERLLETTPEEQLDVLCDGTEENNAALALVFVMFLESERMERQMAEDLSAFGSAGSSAAGPDEQMADRAAAYIRARVAELAGRQQDKDAAKDAALSKAPKKKDC